MRAAMLLMMAAGAAGSITMGYYAYRTYTITKLVACKYAGVGCDDEEEDEDDEGE